jgi:hypothetical protein
MQVGIKKIPNPQMKYGFMYHFDRDQKELGRD